MDAIETGAKHAEKFRLYSCFEKMTRDQYYEWGLMKGRQAYKTEQKIQDFVRGWIAANQQFFKLMADGPKRRVTVARITIECDKCGFEEKLKISSEDDVTQHITHFKNKPCPKCQKADRHIDDEFDTEDFHKVES